MPQPNYDEYHRQVNNALLEEGRLILSELNELREEYKKTFSNYKFTDIYKELKKSIAMIQGMLKNIEKENKKSSPSNMAQIVNFNVIKTQMNFSAKLSVDCKPLNFDNETKHIQKMEILLDNLKTLKKQCQNKFGKDRYKASNYETLREDIKTLETLIKQWNKIDMNTADAVQSANDIKIEFTQMLGRFNGFKEFALTVTDPRERAEYNSLTPYPPAKGNPSFQQPQYANYGELQYGRAPSDQSNSDSQYAPVQPRFQPARPQLQYVSPVGFEPSYQDRPAAGPAVYQTQIYRSVQQMQNPLINPAGFGHSSHATYMSLQLGSSSGPYGYYGDVTVIPTASPQPSSSGSQFGDYGSAASARDSSSSEYAQIILPPKPPEQENQYQSLRVTRPLPQPSQGGSTAQLMQGLGGAQPQKPEPAPARKSFPDLIKEIKEHMVDYKVGGNFAYPRNNFINKLDQNSTSLDKLRKIHSEIMSSISSNIKDYEAIYNKHVSQPVQSNSPTPPSRPGPGFNKRS